MIFPAIILLEKNKIIGKTKKGLLIYKAINLKTKEKYYVPTSIKSKCNIYGLLKEENKSINNIKMSSIYSIFDIYDINKSIEKVLLYKYNLYKKNEIIENIEDLNNFDKYLQNYNIEDKTYKNNIISIDPEGCIDIDDAFSIDLENKIINIYISSILNINYDNIYEYAMKRLSSIYNIYNENIHMIPKDLMLKMSLLEGKKRIAVEINYNVKKNEYSWSLVYIIVNKNFSYDNIYESDYMNIINKTAEYLNILDINIDIDINMNETKLLDVHKLIEKLMLMTNSYIGSLLKNKNIGIFRNQKANYSVAEYSFTPEKHFSLNIENYLHFSSPIRRFVDVINHMYLYYNNININILSHSFIENINNFNLNLKKYYWDINYIKLVDIIDKKNGYYITYIKILYKINDEIYVIYFPEFDIKININLNINNIHYIYDYIMNIEITTKKSNNIINNKLLIKIINSNED